MLLFNAFIFLLIVKDIRLDKIYIAINSKVFKNLDLTQQNQKSEFSFACYDFRWMFLLQIESYMKNVELEGCANCLAELAKAKPVVQKAMLHVGGECEM